MDLPSQSNAQARAPLAPLSLAPAFGPGRQPAAPLPSTSFRIVETDVVTGFVAACDAAVDLAFDTPGIAELLPGDVAPKAALLKAFLLFLATEGRIAGENIELADYDDWYARLDPEVWTLLGFGGRGPGKVTVALAFSLLGKRQHQAPELRALIWLVGELAARNLLHGFRS
jgi:hypothetical protein